MEYCEQCKKEFLTGEFITHMIQHPSEVILVAILAKLIEMSDKLE